jgi:hypothetical protein
MIDKRHLDHLGSVSSLCALLGARHIPAGRLVAARRALKRDPPLAEMQQGIVTVETAQELPKLVGDHCAEPLSEYLPGMTTVQSASFPGDPRFASPAFQEKCHGCGRMPKRLVLKGLTKW